MKRRVSGGGRRGTCLGRRWACLGSEGRGPGQLDGGFGHELATRRGVGTARACRVRLTIPVVVVGFAPLTERGEHW